MKLPQLPTPSRYRWPHRFQSLIQPLSQRSFAPHIYLIIPINAISFSFIRPTVVSNYAAFASVA